MLARLQSLKAKFSSPLSDAERAQLREEAGVNSAGFDPWGLRPETAEQVLVPFVPDEYTFWEQSRDFLKFMFVDPAKETFNRGSRRFEESFQAAYGGDPALAVLSFTAAVGDGVSIVLDFTPAGKAKSKLLGVADDLQVSRATRNTDDILYRGVPGNATEKARLGQQGVAKPRGTATDPDSLRRHVLGEDVDSGVVSFSTDRNVARRFSGEGGTIIEVPRSSVQDRIVPRPDVGKYADESEVLIQGTVQGRATRP